MKPIVLLKALNNVKDSYILSAEDFRQGRARKTVSWKRVWLIAAVIALMLLLVGCTVVYMLRMQDLKVGEYSFDVPEVYDSQGNLIPVETQEPLVLLSMQGTNMEALSEWLSFTNSYDRDGTVALEADRAAREGSADSPWNFPENYHLTYGCYSQEMVDRLLEIVEKYDLKLLSQYIAFDWWESRALLDSLSIDSLLYDDSGAEYWDGYLYLEGTFDINILMTLDMGDWTWEEEYVTYRYSRKDYFDPATGAMSESRKYTQWDYTRRDGKTVLLVLCDTSATIYADLPEALVTISMNSVMWEDGEPVPLTEKALEQMAELFDLDVKPQPTTMETVESNKARAKALYEADRAKAKAEHEEKYLLGYKEFVNYRLQSNPSPATLSYALWDLNKDGTEELMINCYDILSIKEGKSYKYFDLQQSGVFFPMVRPCEGTVFEVWCENMGIWQHYFYQAGPEGASFITGVIYEEREDCWYRSLSGGTRTENREKITRAEAQNILDSYTPIEFDWLPLKKFGEPVESIHYTDPYARYISNMLDRYEDAAYYQYCLMDLNGDGTVELLTWENLDPDTEEGDLRIHTLRDGNCWDFDIDINAFSYICEGGVIAQAEEYRDSGGGAYYEFFRVTEEGLESIERVIQERGLLYWSWAESGKDFQTVTEEKARSIINSYRRITPEWKPFTEYPFQ